MTETVETQPARHVGVVSFVNAVFGFLYGWSGDAVENRYFNLRSSPSPEPLTAGMWVTYESRTSPDGRPQAAALVAVSDPANLIGDDAIAALDDALRRWRDGTRPPRPSVPAPATASVEADARAAFEELRQRGDLDGARALYERYLAEAAASGSQPNEALFGYAQALGSYGRPRDAIEVLLSWVAARRVVSNWDRFLHELSRLFEACDVRLEEARAIIAEQLDAAVPAHFRYRTEHVMALAAMRSLDLNAAIEHALAAVQAKPSWAEGQVLVRRLRPHPAVEVRDTPPEVAVRAGGAFDENPELVAQLLSELESMALRGDWEAIRNALEDVASHGEDLVTAVVVWIDLVCDTRWSVPEGLLEEFLWSRVRLVVDGRHLTFVFAQALCTRTPHALRELWRHLRGNVDHVRLLAQAIREPLGKLLETVHRHIFPGFAREERLLLEALLDIGVPQTFQAAIVLQSGYAARDAGEPEVMLRQWFLYATRKTMAASQGTLTGDTWRTVAMRLQERSSALEHGQPAHGLIALCVALGGGPSLLARAVATIRARPPHVVPELTFRARRDINRSMPFHAIDALIQALVINPEWWPALWLLDGLVRSPALGPELPESVLLQLDAGYESLLVGPAGDRAAGLRFVQAGLKELLGYGVDDIAATLREALSLQPNHTRSQQRLREVQADWLRKIQPGLLLDDLETKQRFEVLERHDNAHGGHGVVLKVRDRAAQSDIRALKVPFLLTSAADGQSGARTRVQREAEKAVMVSGHPNVVQTYGVVGPSRDWILMEWVDGDKLDTFLSEFSARSLQPLEVGHVGLQVVRALVHANHRARDRGQSFFVHNDLAPWNIMVVAGQAGLRVKVFDFGLAHTGVVGSQTRTLLLDLREKRKYRSPELAQGLPPDERSDIYTLGVVLYELLRGSPVSYEELDGFRSEPVDGGPDQALLDVLTRMLAPEREARYRLDELEVDLQKYLAQRTLSHAD